MKETISYLVFLVHYYAVMAAHAFTAKRNQFCAHYHRWAQHMTFFGVNLFFLATYDTIKEYVLPFGLIGLGIFLLVSKADW